MALKFDVVRCRPSGFELLIKILFGTFWSITHSRTTWPRTILMPSVGWWWLVEFAPLIRSAEIYSLVYNLKMVFPIRLKKINPMSQSYRTHLFFGARLIQQNSRFEFFFCSLDFFSVFYDLLVKKYKKRYDRHNETLWTTNFFIFCVLPCILFIQNQVPYFKAVTDSNVTRLLLRKKKKKKKKTLKIRI